MNADIKNEMRTRGIRQWKVAQTIGISERTLICWLRSELTPDRASRINAAMDQLSKGGAGSAGKINPYNS